MKPLICIAGQNSIAVKGLQLVAERYSQHAICYIPTPSDKSFNQWQPSLIKKAEELGITRVSLDEIYEEENLIFISLQFSEIIKTKKFKTKHLYNVHFSKLPKYKGVYTSIHPIRNGEQESGVTLHYIDDGIDTGDIIAQSIVNISINDTARDFYIKQLESAYLLFEDNLDQLVQNTILSYPQLAEGASYYSKSSINYSDIKFDLNKTAYEIHNQFRALNFREYQMPIYRDWQILKTNILEQKSTQKAGTLIEESEAHYIIATVDFDLKLIKDYYPALWSACETGDISQLNHILAFIDDLNLRNKHGWNALIIASYHGHVDIMNVLIKRGSSLDSTNYKGTTLLMYALSHFEKSANDDAFKLLLELNTDTSMRDGFGKNIKDYLTEKGLHQMCTLL